MFYLRQANLSLSLTTTTGTYRPGGFTSGEIASSNHLVGEVGFRVGLDDAGKREICASRNGTSVV